ncbi:hypothetical protein ACIPRD_06965 [Streptomyces sp. NPDC090108]|uniref:hypothetical protein n=1 Tax=Streptomyces sp. NPDC090108 TaxID=3365947 RepID=UPI00381088B4
MDELIFRGRDRYRLSWRHLIAPVAAIAVQLFLAAQDLSSVAFSWLTAGAFVLLAGGLWSSRRSWTRVGADGITICWGIGRGRTHPWREIRWIDTRDINGRTGMAYTARITLTNRRRRSLPALTDSATYPLPDFDADVQRIMDWWELSTDPSARFRPPQRLRDRIGPRTWGVVLGLAIAAALALHIFVLRHWLY